MFSQLLKYRLIGSLRVWQILFWNLAFPIALSTFMFLAMSSLIHPGAQEPVPVQADDPLVEEVLEGITFQDAKLYELVSLPDPRDAVAQEQLTAYAPEASPPVVVARERTMDVDTLSSILINIDRARETADLILQENPSLSPEAVTAAVSEQEDVFAEDSEEPKLILVNFFYTVLALVCLGAVTLGVVNVYETEARFSAMGKRLGIVPHRKTKFLFPFTIASLLFNTLYAVITLLYFNFVLKIPFGDNTPAVLATIVLGSLFGLSIGMVIGLLVKGSLDVRMNIGIGVYIFSSFLAGMMSMNVRQMIAIHAPFLHKINPSSLITDTFSSLYYFDDLKLFWENMIIMGLMTLALLGVVWLLTRREQHEYL